MGYYDSKTLGRFPARTKTDSRSYYGSTDERAADPTPLLFFMDSKGRIQATKSGFETASWGGSGNYSFSITSPYSDVPINSYPAGYAYASIISVWASRCIEIRSESVARIKREVVDRRTKKPVPNHPLSVALRRAQEHGENIYALWEHCKLVFGEVFLWPIKNDYQRAGLVTGHSDLAWLNNLGMNVLTIGGKIGGFSYAPVSGGRVRQFEPHQLAFYKTLNLFNNLRGLSPLDSILLELGIDKDVSRVTKAWYANDARPGLVLVPEVDVGIEAGKEFMQYWKDNFQGARNAGKPVIMPSVIKEIKELNRAPSPDDVEIRESMRREICARFGVPLSIAGAWDDATYQSAPEQRKSLYEETIIPECEDLDKWFTVTVLPYFDESGQCEVKTDLTDVKALIEDEGVKGAISNQRFLAGGTSFNEYRHELGKPPVPDDFFVRPQGYSIVPYADVGKPTPPTPETSAPSAFGGSGLIAPHPDATPPQQPFAPKPTAPSGGTTTGRAKADITAEDELSAWRKKAMNGGSLKALTFVCYALPKDIESHIRSHLKPNMDKTALKAVFDEAAVGLKKIEPIKDWDESKHPREDNGQFGEGGGTSGDSKEPDADKPPAPNPVPPPKKPKSPAADRNQVVGSVSADEFSKQTGLTPDDVISASGADAIPLDKYPDSKVTTQIEKTEDGGYKATVKIAGEGNDIENGIVKNVDIERHLYFDKNGKPSYVENDHFYLPSSETGTGLGTQMLKSQVDNAAAMGFREIKTRGGKSAYMNGYYTWPRMGYDGEVQYGTLHTSNFPFLNDVPHTGGGGLNNYKVSDIMKTPEGREFWKKYGQEMDFSFDLGKRSRSRKLLNAYYKQRFG